MKREMLGECPVCQSELEVTRLSCNNCDTSIEGHFSVCKFSTLSSKQKIFLEAFIKNRGNIKEIEKDLGISYPTVRNKLEDLIQSLGYTSQPTEPIVNKKEILERLSREEISSEEAIKLLQGEE